MVTKIIANRFTPREKIGSGAFGDTFSAVALRTGNVVALKVENKRARQLEREARIYKELRGGVAIPKIHWYGSEGEYNFMAMDLLGPSLDELFELCSRRFTLKTVLMLADQMISRIEYVHTKNYVHRDIKPANFLMGANVNCNLCYLVDFGLAKKYRDESLAHSEFTEHHDLIGTARYASINAHLGSQLSRRDDLESLAYVLLYFLRGELPWQGVTAATKKEKYGKMLQKKMDTSVSALCRGLPGEFAMFLTYARGLRFDEEPNYVFIRTLFRILFQTMNYDWDHKFDWYRFSGKLGFMTSKENVEERKGDRLV